MKKLYLYMKALTIVILTLTLNCDTGAVLKKVGNMEGATVLRADGFIVSLNAELFIGEAVGGGSTVGSGKGGSEEGAEDIG